MLDANGNDLTDSSHIGNRNPFRYRGYFYDVETGLYYLQTRYYDPEIGRFLNMDDISYADPEQFHGLNLYAYCANNPVNYVDPTGHEWWHWLITAVSIVALTITGIGLSIAASAATTALAGFGLAAAGGGLLGMSSAVTSSIVSQAHTKGWDNVDFKEAWKSGGIGLAIGAITGVISFGVGQLAHVFGEKIGYTLSKMVIANVEVSKVYSASTLIKVFGKGLEIIGSATAAFTSDYFCSQLFRQTYTEQSAKDSRDSIILGWLSEFIAWMFRV